MRAILAALLWLGGPAAWAEIAENPKPAEQIPQSIWKVEADGALTHRHSQLACPVLSAAFRRGKAVVYDRAGFDVSCGYNRQGGAITMYLTRHGQDTLQDDYADAKRQLVEHEASASLVSETPVPLTTAVPWLTAIYTEKDGLLETGIWMAEYSGWMFEFRATYAPAARADFLAQMEKLAAAAEPARRHLARCAKSGPIVRGGTPVTDKAVIASSMMMLSLMGGAGEAAAEDASKASPLYWCAEGPLGGVPAILWHAVNEDGSDALADRVTPITLDEPIALQAAPNPLAALFSDDKAGDNPAKWYASIRTGKQTWFFAITSGRPSAESLTALLRDIIGKKARPVGGYSVDGKSITITTPPS